MASTRASSIRWRKLCNPIRMAGCEHHQIVDAPTEAAVPDLEKSVSKWKPSRQQVVDYFNTVQAYGTVQKSSAQCSCRPSKIAEYILGARDDEAWSREAPTRRIPTVLRNFIYNSRISS